MKLSLSLSVGHLARTYIIVKMRERWQAKLIGSLYNYVCVCGLVPLSSCADSFATNSIITKMELAQREHQVWASKHSSRVIDPSYSISCAVRESHDYSLGVLEQVLCSGVGVSRDLVWGKQKGIHIKIGRATEIKKKKAWLTKTVSGVVKVMGSATSTAWHIQSGRPATDSNLLPVRASSKMSSRRESAVNSTYIYQKSIALKICVIFYQVHLGKVDCQKA